MSSHEVSRRSFGRSSAALLALSSVAVVAACSGSAGVSFSTSSGQGSGGSGNVGGARASSGGLGGGFAVGSGAGDGNAGSGGIMACAAQPYQAAQLPLDMFLMLDQSKSMSQVTAGGPTKWAAVTSALQGFVGEPGLGGISLGLQYFGLPPGGAPQCTNVPQCNTTADCGPTGCGKCKNHQCVVTTGGGGMQDSCVAADYSVPAVETAPLPGVGAAIVGSLGGHQPSTSTPTSAALQGALDHSKAWAAAHPGHVVIAVLATDGEPTECDTNVADIAATAATALGGSPSVKTFAIGVFAPADVPSGPDALNQIAAAGGTGQAFVIDTSNPGQNVETQFLMALNAIRGAALGCQYAIPLPEAGTPDYANLNVQYTPGGGGAPESLLNYPDAAHCPASGDGWYYDNAAAPTQILLCGSTCAKVSADMSGKIEVLLGCKTMIGGIN